MIELSLSVFALLFSLSIFVYVTSLFFAEFLGAPFVPTDPARLQAILDAVPLRAGKNFYDLGSGDGRVVLAAVSRYTVSGLGIEANFFLVLWSRLRARVLGLPQAKFRFANFWLADLTSADYIYCYLTPRAMRRLGPKFSSQLKPGTIIISRAFSISRLQPKLVHRWSSLHDNLFVYRI